MKRRKLKASLFGRFIAITLLVLAFLTGCFWVINQYEKQLLKENTLQMNEKLLQQINSKVEEFYKTFQNIASMVMYSPTAYNYVKANVKERILTRDDLFSVFLSAMELEENIDGIYLFDENLRQIVGMKKETVLTARLEETLEEIPNQMTFGNLIQPEGEEVYYLIQFPIYDLDNPQYGVLLGMAVFQMKIDGYMELLGDTQATEYSQMYLIDGNQRVIASDSLEKLEEITEDMLNDPEEFHVQVQKCGIGDWQIVSRIPVWDLYRESRGVKWMMQYIFVIAAVLMGCLVLFCYVYLIRPIRQLEQFIKMLTEDSSCRLESRREDEIGTVIRSMNHMLDKIDEANREQQISQKKAFEAEIAKKQMQVLAYRNQINPHFLYNTFECIRAMALYYDAEDIAEITMALSRIFRFATKGENIVSISQEVNYIREYGKIIGYRFMDKIDIQIEVEPGCQEKKVIKLLLQPLVENAVFHGLEQTMEGGEVLVSVRSYKEKYLEIRIEDDGCGIPPEKLEHIMHTLSSSKKEEGIGIANIYQRLHLFYGDDVIFEIQSREGEGTQIRIVIPDHISE
ncbi:MAG: histidine kinase [Eubacteriales bacterium]|nr:histidine kinase [Eubacteriales bacterium]